MIQTTVYLFRSPSVGLRIQKYEKSTTHVN